MGVGYYLINLDKEEVLSFNNIGTDKWREIAGIVVASSLVSTYMIYNTGDRISFVNDTDKDFELFGNTYSWSDFSNYKEITDNYVQVLIDNEVYRDDGKVIYDQEGNYVRNLTNIWDPKFPWNR